MTILMTVMIKNMLMKTTAIDDDPDDKVDDGDDEEYADENNGKHRNIRCTWVFSNMSQQSAKLLR